MILPIIGYGHPVLKRKTLEISADYKDLQQLITSMYETMYNASGVGLAAPQIGLSIRVFVVDSSPFSVDDKYTEEQKIELKNFKKTFINPIITQENGDDWSFDEGCLSIPYIREPIFRKSNIKIEYYNEDFKFIKESYSGLLARVIQHEYDHIEGVLFTDKLSSFKKQLLKKKLNKISIGKVKADYLMEFYKKLKK